MKNKFTIKIGRQKKQTITGTTVAEYLKAQGASAFGICPTGGWAIIKGKEIGYDLTILACREELIQVPENEGVTYEKDREEMAKAFSSDDCTWRDYIQVD